jgi:hypothetical protein
MAACFVIAIELILESPSVRLTHQGGLYEVRAEARRTRDEAVEYRPAPPWEATKRATEQPCLSFKRRLASVTIKASG